MATFLDEPDIRSLRPQRGSQGSPEADTVSGLAGAIDYIGSKVKQKRADQAVVEKGQAIGDATTSLLNLKDERANLLDEESSFRDTVSNIYADGTVTEEEKATLDSMSDQKDKLARARKSGVLNETAYNTRYNAMWKQNLSNVSNLALQGEINSIFGSGIATFQEPVNTQEAQMTASLDQQYGKGKEI